MEYHALCIQRNQKQIIGALLVQYALKGNSQNSDKITPHTASGMPQDPALEGGPGTGRSVNSPGPATKTGRELSQINL